MRVGALGSVWRTLVALGLLACGSEGGIGVDVPPVPSGEPPPRETPIQVDQVTQVLIPEVEVLFVVDNSCSMEEEQAALSKNFPQFLDWFLESGLSYHIGVVSTDMRDPEQAGRLRVVDDVKWIDDKTKSPEKAFVQMVGLGVEGDYVEKGRAAAYTAVELLRQSDNAGFVRDNAGLHITVISDENDSSGNSPISRDEFVAYLQQARPGHNKVSFSSIVGPVTGCADIGEPGTEYLFVTGQVGGVTWPICEADWVAVLDELGFLAVGLSQEFFLSRLPVPGTIEVTVELDGVVTPYVEGVDWTYQSGRNSIRFDFLVPEPRSVVRMTYEVLAALEADPS